MTRLGNLSAGSPVPDLTRRGLTRAQFLSLPLLAGLAGAVPRGVGAPAAVSAAAVDAGLEGLSSDGRFPLGLWWPPPPYQTTVERYQEVAAAGFTFMIGGNYLNDRAINTWALRTAVEVGLRFIVVDPQLTCLTHDFDIAADSSRRFTVSLEEAQARMTEVLKDYTPFESFAGVNLYDEPSTAKFPTVANAAGLLRTVSPGAIPYVNLLPGTGAQYDEYLRRFVAQVRPSLLSFDRYPLLTAGDDTQYFLNWSQIRAVALEAGLPVMTFIQSVGFSGHRVPTQQELFWQVNVSLAFGAKGIQYFTYWTPEPARGFEFTGGPIAVDGQRTPMYEAAYSVNEYLSAVGAILLPLTSESVSVTGLVTPPPGLNLFQPDEYVAAASGDPVILSRFRSPCVGEEQERWLFVANLAHDKLASATLTLGPAVQSAARHDHATGAFTTDRALAGSPHVILAPGAARLYRLSSAPSPDCAPAPSEANAP